MAQRMDYMENRLDDFLKGKITPGEFDALKNAVDGLDDGELSRLLDDRDADVDFSAADIAAVRERLNRDITGGNRKPKRRLYILAASLAACTLVLLACGISLMQTRTQIEEYDEFLGRRISIATGAGEYTQTTLPDGSKVKMGPESELSYTLASFNDAARVIDYSGEGDFSIGKNADAPFTLNAPDFRVTVLGTEFCLRTRASGDDSEVYLESGSIEITSSLSNESKRLKPGDIAVLSRADGRIRIYNDSSYRRTVGYPVIYFNSTPFSEVALEFGRYYGSEIAEADSLGDINFTGSLPTNNLEQAVFILEKSLDKKLTIIKSEDSADSGKSPDAR